MAPLKKRSETVVTFLWASSFDERWDEAARSDVAEGKGFNVYARRSIPQSISKKPSSGGFVDLAWLFFGIVLIITTP